MLPPRPAVYEKVFAGELDFTMVYGAQQWVDAAEEPAVRNGWALRRKVDTRRPRGIQGLAFNTRRAPLNDVRVRKALAHLFDRRQMVEKFAHGEYDLLKSYFAGSVVERDCRHERIPVSRRRL